MATMGERAYVYGKACGIIGKSFLGKRTSSLGSLGRLSDMDRLVFQRDARDLPEGELLPDLEDRSLQKTVRQILSIINAFARPPEFLVLLLLTYEYADLKALISAALAGEAEPPHCTDLGRYGSLHTGAYPNLEAVVQGTAYTFILEKLHKAGVEKLSAGDMEKRETSPELDLLDMRLQTELDQHYYRRLWEALHQARKNDRAAAGHIIAEEISLRNALWALRFRVYYHMSEESIRERLVYLPLDKGDAADDAIAALTLELDTWEHWAHWKRAAFLNQPEDVTLWSVDPRHFQNAAAAHLYGMTRRAFHRHPFSLDTAACFIKLKQFEEDLLTSVAEGLGLGLSGEDVFSLIQPLEGNV